MKKTNKVLVTGAGGFIGSHLVEELIRKMILGIYRISYLTND